MNVVSSKIEICNIALDYLNVRNITSLDENTKPAQKCSIWYDIVRKKTLINLNASFSKKRTVLAEDTNFNAVYTDDKHVYGYNNAFIIPSDCLHILNVGDPKQNITYQIEGKYIFCNMNDKCPVTYIADIKDVTLFDANFVTLLAMKLAEQICLPLTEDEQKYANIKQAAMQEYIECSAKYGNDNKITAINTPRFRNSRYSTFIPNSNRNIR